jgi:hypothetical protein
MPTNARIAAVMPVPQHVRVRIAYKALRTANPQTPASMALRLVRSYGYSEALNLAREWGEETSLQASLTAIAARKAMQHPGAGRAVFGRTYARHRQIMR